MSTKKQKSNAGENPMNRAVTSTNARFAQRSIEAHEKEKA